MLNININKLSESYTFSPGSNEWAHNNYLERDEDESIDAVIRRLIPNGDKSGSGRGFACSSQQIEAFITSFRRLEPGDDIDYSALIEDSPTPFDADDFYDGIQEVEEEHFLKYNSPACDHRTDDSYDHEDFPCPQEDCDEWDEFQSEATDAVEQESEWAVGFITFLELFRETEMWAGLSSSLLVGELCNFHDDEGRSLVALVVGELEVLVDGVVINIADDSHKIKESLSSQSIAA